MKSRWSLFIGILSVLSIFPGIRGAYVQDFAVEILFIPDNDSSRAQTRTFAGHATSSDGFDANDEMSAPPGFDYYVYFDLGVFPTFMTTDSRAWTFPYNVNKTWSIVITNAINVMSTLAWQPDSLPRIPGGKFTLNGVSEGSVDMLQEESATVSGNAVLTIDYTCSGPIQRTLTINIKPQDAGTVTKNPDQITYDDSTVVHLIAEATEGYRFLNWDGDVEDKFGGETIVLMDTNKTITANFIREYTLTIIIDPLGGGSTNPVPGNHTYDAGTNVNITANPSEGYQFETWEGDVENPLSDTTTVTMDTNKTIISRFVVDSMVEEGKGLIPLEYKLRQNYPNPFNPRTVIEYTLPELRHTVIEVYNIRGEKIRTLVNEMKRRGHHQVVWDAKSENGEFLHSGTYFIQIVSGDFRDTLKAILLN